jgi:hypothetical protein
MAITLALLLTEIAWLRGPYKALVPVSRPVETGLALNVQPKGRALQVSWDPNSQAVRGSDHAILHIIDGTHHSNLDLNTAEINVGRLVYWPETEHATFRMEVNGSNLVAGTIQPAGPARRTIAGIETAGAGKPSPFALPRPRFTVQKVSVPASPDLATRTEIPTAKPAGSFFRRMVHKIPVLRRLQKSPQPSD